MPHNEPSRREMGRYWALSQVGLEMVAPMLLGWWVDSLLGTAPWLLVSGLVVGSIGGMVHLVILSKDEETPPRKKNGS